MEPFVVVLDPTQKAGMKIGHEVERWSKIFVRYYILKGERERFGSEKFLIQLFYTERSSQYF